MDSPQSATDQMVVPDACRPSTTAAQVGDVRQDVDLSQPSHRLVGRHRIMASALDALVDPDLQIRIVVNWPDSPHFSTDQKVGGSSPFERASQ